MPSQSGWEGKKAGIGWFLVNLCGKGTLFLLWPTGSLRPAARREDRLFPEKLKN